MFEPPSLGFVTLTLRDPLGPVETLIVGAAGADTTNTFTGTFVPGPVCAPIPNCPEPNPPQQYATLLAMAHV